MEWGQSIPNVAKVLQQRGEFFKLWPCPYYCTGQRDMTITQKDLRKLRTFHMNCLRDILGVTR